MHPPLVRWINNFLSLTFDFCAYGESQKTLNLRKNRFKDYDTDDDYFTNSTTYETQPTCPIRFYGEFGISDQIKRRHSRYFFDQLWLYLLTTGLHHADRQLAFQDVCTQFRDPRKYWFATGRDGSLWYNLRDNRVPRSEWKKNLRMTETQFYKFLSFFEGSLEPGRGPNWRSVSGAHKLAFFLFFLAHKAEVGTVSKLFGISIQSGSNYVRDIAHLICKKIQKKLIHMPWSDADMKAKVTAYEKRFGLSSVFGAVDGSHFKISKPPENHVEYLCYKGYHSFNVQAICDSDGTFLDVYAAHPGRIHDSKLLDPLSVVLIIAH